MSTALAATFEMVFQAATRSLPYPWQQALALRERPAKAIVAPTGAGKTEAVLLDWLWRRVFNPRSEVRQATPRRLVVALPMRALVEQTRARIDAALQRLGRRTEHIKTYTLMGGAADDSWTLAPTAEAVLVGTIDMLLSRALNRSFGRGRSVWPIDFGLINSDCLWVLDEVQLMDAAVATSAQLQAFREALGTAAPTRTIWMSATLSPSWLQTRDHPGPDQSDIASLQPADRVGPLARRLNAAKQLVREAANPESAAELATIVMREHHLQPKVGTAPYLTLAMCNTVDRAIRLYDEIRAKIDPSVELLLLHSRFRQADRARLVAQLEQPPPPGGRVVVTTQVIEAGVDLDAGALISEIAPWASLVQRAGRLNRAGDRPAARFIWIDPGEEQLASLAPPYEPDDLLQARRKLQSREGGPFSPACLEQPLEPAPAQGHELPGARRRAVLLRRADLIDLFDTDPTLDGDDPDVGRFIRVSEDLDVGVAWRALPGPTGPAVGDPLPQHAEVCPVPISQASQLVSLGQVWRWAYQRRRWERAGAPPEIRPGDLIIVDANVGGYDQDRGWTGKGGAPVKPVEIDGAVGGIAEGDADDPESASPTSGWLTLIEHTDDVVDELERMLRQLDLGGEWADALRLAARAHDAGKAHDEFQQRLRRWAGEDPPTVGIYAKAPQNVAWRPQHSFRHELASALLLMNHHRWSRTVDLAGYLVAAHHGKVRLTPRLSHESDDSLLACLGLRQDDLIPAVDVGGSLELGPLKIDLSPLRLGSLDGVTWTERTLDLRDRWGPFVLAYLEALLRCADQNASRLEQR
jgi:CRISPR-associated endonuclease/helicase Cas3